jgi:hypothetical protein
MNKSTTLPIPRRGDEKRYSLNQLISTLSVVIFVTFILGTIFGLKVGSHPSRSVITSKAVQTPEASTQLPERIIPSYEERTRSSPEKEAAWDRAMAARRAELGNQGTKFRMTEDNHQKTSTKSSEPHLVEGEIGLWEDSNVSSLTHYVQLVKVSSNKIGIRKYFSDGSNSSEEWDWSGSTIPFPHSPGDYYKLDDGQLSCWDAEGFIFKLKKLR